MIPIVTEPTISVPLSKVPTRVLLEPIYTNQLRLEQMMADSTADIQQITDLLNNIGSSVTSIDESTSQTVSDLAEIEQLLNDGAETAAIQEALSKAQQTAEQASQEASDAAAAAAQASGLVPTAPATEEPPVVEPPVEQPPTEEPPV